MTFASGTSTTRAGKTRIGTVRKRRRNKKNQPLNLIPKSQRPREYEMVNVRQGDAQLIRRPGGRHILIDGGEEARLLASPGLFRDRSLMTGISTQRLRAI